MKKLCLLATLLLTTALHAQLSATIQQGQPKGPSAKAAVSMILFNWTYDYSAVPVCTTAVQANCVKNFILSEGTVQITIPATTATTYQYSLSPLPTQGNHFYNLVAVEVLTGTATITSTATGVNVMVPQGPPAPANFTAVPQ